MMTCSICPASPAPLAGRERDDPRIHVLAHEMVKHAFHARDDLV